MPSLLYAKVLKKMDIMRFVWYNKRNNPRTADYKAVRGDFVILCGYCSAFHGICLVVGLVGGYR